MSFFVLALTYHLSLGGWGTCFRPVANDPPGQSLLLLDSSNGILPHDEEKALSVLRNSVCPIVTLVSRFKTVERIIKLFRHFVAKLL